MLEHAAYCKSDNRLKVSRAKGVAAHDEDQLDEEADEAHDDEAQRCLCGDFVEFCNRKSTSCQAGAYASGLVG